MRRAVLAGMVFGAVIGGDGGVAAQALTGVQVIAGKRAEVVVREANADSLLASYPAVAAFLADGPTGWGTANPVAPAETAEWGRLAGAWYVENAAFVNGQWYCCWNAVWAWRYILDGFGVQDFWYQKAADLPPTVKSDRATSLTQLRVWRDDVKEWFIAFVTAGGREAPAGVSGTFRAYADGPDRMIMEPSPAASGPRARIVFFDIGQDHFRWKRETSEDDGATWVEGFRIEAWRIPGVIPGSGPAGGPESVIRPGGAVRER